MTRLVILPGTDGTGALLDEFLDATRDLQPLVLAYPVDRPLDYVGLLAHVAPRMPAAPYVLLGESFGGPLALALAAQRPAGLAGIVLCASFARLPYRVLHPFLRLASGLPPRRVPIGCAARLLLGRWDTPRWRERLEDVLARIPGGVLQARVRAALDADQRGILARLPVPLLYLQGSEDRLMPDAVGRAVVDGAAEATLVRVTGPHFLLQAAPVACGDAVRRFVQDVSAVQQARLASTMSPG